MNPIISLIIRSFVAVPLSVIIWLLSFFAFSQTFLLSCAFAIAGGVITHLFLGLYMQAKFLKKHRLSRKEYIYILKNLSEAKRKIHRLNRTLFAVHDKASIKQRIDILRISKKIYKITAKEPKRFYKAEPFYFSHLDSVVELTETFGFLSNQPVKNMEIEQSLTETRKTLNGLTNTLEEDLYKLISDDIDHLNFEIDVAKQTLKMKKDSKSHEENRW